MKLRLPKYDADLVEQIEQYLELDATTAIEVTSTDEEDGLVYTFAFGRALKSNSRPMFQVIEDQAFSGMALGVSPCACYDFHRTWNCPDHHEIPYNTDKKNWERPHIEGSETCFCTPCREASYSDTPGHWYWSEEPATGFFANNVEVHYAAEHGTATVVFETDPRA